MLKAKWQGRLGLTYRRRTDNTGFKAGNVFDFCTRWGADYDLAVTLDADSFQTADSILRMVRIMQIEPKLGILQSLVVGMPSTSAFARIFQFGMRLGMRSYTLGSAWWQGDCGPYWGHNAVIRLAPFIAHCHIPPRPDGTHILSHDQIEAVLMRRAGYEVRVLPEEGASWEENPPTLLEFIRRDLRWAQGNMQYWPYLVMPGLKPVSRYQIAFAMLMFLGSPAWMGLLVLGTLAVAIEGPGEFHPARRRHGAVHHHADHVVRAEDRNRDRCGFAAELAQFLRRRRPLHRQHRHRDDLLPDALADHVVRPYDVSRRPGARPPPRLGRTGARRSCGAVERCGAAALAAHAARLELHPDPRLHGAVRDPLRAVHRGGAGALHSARRHHVVARRRPGADARRHRRAAGRERAALRPAPARAAGDRCGGAADALMSDDERTRRGIERSLRIYYDDQRDTAAMDRLYARFVKPGDLVFDVGSHVGDRIAAFRRLGARVVACEPNPPLVKTLRLIYGRDSNVTIEPVAVGAAAGEIELKINVDNPTVSTASPDFVKASGGAPGWEGQNWDKSIKVPMTTLDALIARHGMPAFMKIDVEGFEAEALAGLTQPVAALSFEFTTIQRDVARACVARCQALGYVRYNAALGESQTLVHDDWQGADAIVRWLDALPMEANSGDVYAMR